MIITFRGLQDQILRQLDRPTEPDDGPTRAIVKDLLNDAHLMRCGEFPWRFLEWPREETISVVAGQATYSLHQEFQRPLRFVHNTRKALMKEVPTRERINVIDPGDLGRELEFAFTGRSAVKAQPSSPTVLTLSSSALTDVGIDYQVAIKGVTAAGDVEVEIVTPNGSTPVATETEFALVLAVTKERAWNGTLSLKAGVTEILDLDPTEMGRQYPQITLLSTPATAFTISYRFYRQPLMLINDYDIPEIPAPHAQILVWDTLVMMASYLTELPAHRVEGWRARAAEHQVALYQAYANEGDSLGAQSEQIRYIADDEGSYA